jgi:hypothetical protein
MKVTEIIQNSLKYPLKDWKKFLILGIIFIILNIAYISRSLGEENVDLLAIFVGIAFVVGFLVNGYIFRIIKSSFDGKVELPKFDNWIDIGLEGAKVYIVYMIYLIPTILLSIVLISSSYNVMLSSGLSTIDLIASFNSVLWQGTLIFISIIILFGTTVAVDVIIRLGILYPIGILYSIIITPIFLVAIANMGYDEGDLKSAFKIREILGEISIIGWGNLIKWYIIMGIIFIAFWIISNIVLYLFSLINPIIGGILLALTIYPYLTMFLARSMALFYLPDEEELESVQ